MEHVTYNAGDFSFLKCEMTRNAFESAYKKITDANMWNFFDTPPPENTGYMFWFGNPVLDKLMRMLDEDGHSGASMAMTLRVMQFIHVNGWENYVKQSH